MFHDTKEAKPSKKTNGKEIKYPTWHWGKCFIFQFKTQIALRQKSIRLQNTHSKSFLQQSKHMWLRVRSLIAEGGAASASVRLYRCSLIWRSCPGWRLYPRAWNLLPRQSTPLPWSCTPRCLDSTCANRMIHSRSASLQTAGREMTKNIEWEWITQLVWTEHISELLSDLHIPTHPAGAFQPHGRHSHAGKVSHTLRLKSCCIIPPTGLHETNWNHFLFQLYTSAPAGCIHAP